MINKLKQLCCGAVILTACLILLTGTVSAAVRKLVILTTNDYHGQLDPIITTEGDSAVELGGSARLKQAIDGFREQYPGSVLAVNAGDIFTGKYFLHFNGEATFAALSFAGIDVATLGNHEFDRGTCLLARALPHCSFPTVASNLVLSETSPLRGKLKDYERIERNGLTIGVFGLMTPDLNRISRAGSSVSVNADLAGCARAVIERMRSPAQPDLIVALTHIGLDADRRLARDVPAIDIICGGHSHDFLGKGEEITVEHAGGGKTLIVQAGARGKYLGVLKLSIENGAVKNHTWDPLRLDRSVAKSPAAEAFLAKYRDRLPPPRALTILMEPLDCRSATVRNSEAAAGNLICDIMREEFKTDIALHNGGGIRGDRIIPAGIISTDDVETMLPFGNTVSIVRLTGKALKMLIEQSAARLPRLSGSFLHVSGLHYTADMSGRPQIVQLDRRGNPSNIMQFGTRVKNMMFVEKDGSLQPLKPDRVYSIALNSYLAGGGDSYFMLAKATERTDTGIMLHKAVETWLARQEAVMPTLDGRIKIVKNENKKRIENKKDSNHKKGLPRTRNFPLDRTGISYYTYKY